MCARMTEVYAEVSRVRGRAWLSQRANVGTGLFSRKRGHVLLRGVCQGNDPALRV